MTAVWQNIWTGLTTASPLDQVNLVVGIIGVWLMIRRSLAAFPLGLVAVSVQGILFYRTRYYADATLQVFFFGALAYGWWHWVRAKGIAAELPVTRLPRNNLLMTMGLTVVGTIVWALLLRKYTDALMPFRDAFIASVSVAAQVLQARKQIENWPFWVVANGVAICSYWIGGLYFTAFLYAVYLILSFAGWWEWQQAMKSEAPVSVRSPEGR